MGSDSHTMPAVVQLPLAAQLKPYNASMQNGCQLATSVTGTNSQQIVIVHPLKCEEVEHGMRVTASGQSR
jgi:hypothetical protein